MTLYSIHFILASVLSALLSAFWRNSIKKRVAASVCAPVVFYILFYNYDFGLLDGPIPFVISYVGAFFAACLSLLITSFHNTFADSFCSYYPLRKYCFSEILFLFLLCLIFTIPWAIDTFPLSNVEAVLFTVFAGNNEGAEEFVLSSFINKVFYPVLWTFIVVLITELALSFVLFKRNIFCEAKLWKIKLRFSQRGFLQILWQVQKTILLISSFYAAILLLVLPGIIMSAPFKTLIQQPIDSEFYRNNYVHPDSVKIEAPEESRNLVVIFLESMEKNFAQYTPEITHLEENSLDFVPGGQNVSGTSWTIAGIIGKLCGIPLNMPMGINEYHGRLPTYVPYAKCLMDVLADKGYNQLYAQGTSGEFTQKKDFWKTHGNVEIHDIEYYKSVRKVPEDYYVFWGFEDRKLYRFVKEELDSLSNLDKPFALYMLTVDTHQPQGFLDDTCKVSLKEVGFAENNLNHFPEALRCASIQLESFIRWMQGQPWFDKTVVFVMGDHATPALSAKVNLPQSDSLYWTNFVVNAFLDSSKTYRQGRTYSSLDIFPTILESMGFELESHAMALGKSLYADSPTLLEKYGRKTLDSLLRERSVQYDYFLMGR
ncbi:MAG: sulfatase-like hydrolase/transferase [Fibrobacter sp.]|nr:sulfatase-like hydrolase/transferase [Fibrobacter sp.]